MERASGKPSAANAIDALKLVRARRLLAGTLDDRRAIVGPVSRAWIRSEVERRVRFADLPEAMRAHPAVRPEDGEPPADLNTNHLPKLEPWINASILTGAMLYGTRLFGGNGDDPSRGLWHEAIDNDLILAAMVFETLGTVDRLSALLPEAARVVDEAYLRELLGPAVVEHTRAIIRALEDFDQAFAAGEAAALALPEPEANAVAAILAARLRLTARAAGDAVFSVLTPAQREELVERGVDPGAPDAAFPERPYLERDFARAKAAVALRGVDHATLRTPIAGQLLLAVENVLHRNVPAGQLVGRYGAAVHHFHAALPIMYRYSPINRRSATDDDGASVELEGPFALGTLHATGLEATRYLHKVRRKGNGTAAAHAFLVAGAVARAVFTARGVVALAGADCHDLVEDGGLAVTGYDQTLEMFASRFGAPLAALVAEVTDSMTRSDGPAKAATFRAQPSIPLPELAYDVSPFGELRTVATHPDVPYTIAGAVIKLADTGVTQDEGTRDPDMMSGVWTHSGARVYWDQTSKGAIVRPILERLVLEIRLSTDDPFYAEREGSLPLPVLEGLRRLIAWFLEAAELYAAQNLTILAGEYALDENGRRELIRTFFDETRSRDEVDSWLDAVLDDQRLAPRVRERGLAASYRVLPDRTVRRDLSQLLDYRDAALTRRAIGRALSCPRLCEDRHEEVARLYALRRDVTGRL